MIKGVPYDAEIAYLESTGTEYVDTGIIPDTLDLSVELTLLSKGGHVFGCRNSSNLVSGNIWSAYSSAATSMRKDWLLSSSSFSISSSIPNTITFSSTTNGSSISYGGQTYTGNAKTTYTYSMILFGVSTAGTISAGKMVIYACKIWKNGVLVRDFIPVRVGTVGYLYDRVTRRLFGNAGTGAFTLGPDVAKPVMSLHRMAQTYFTASDYVKNGLISMWDGIENAGWGTHRNVAPYDLISGTQLSATSGVEIGNNYFRAPGGKYFYVNTQSFATAVNLKNFTVEIVCKNTRTSNADIIGIGGSSARGVWCYGGATYNLATVNLMAASYAQGTSVFFASNNPFRISVCGGTSPKVYTDSMVTNLSYGFLSSFSENRLYIGALSNTFHAADTYFYSLRLYNRVLSEAEVAHNFAVDKFRFGIGGAS